MVDELSIIFKMLTLGAIIAAAGLWAGAGIDSRPKHRDEQTLIGGTIWSQSIIVLGLVISQSIEEDLDMFVRAYFLLTDIIFSILTGVCLLVSEYKALMRFRKLVERNPTIEGIDKVIKSYDKIYVSIGILSLVAGGFTCAEFVMLLT